MPATPGMKGGGFYDQHSTAQAASIRVLHGWMEQAVADVRLPPEPQPIVAADFGSSEGRNAIETMHVLVTGLRRRRPTQPIQTFYSDLPTNNFNRLFANLTDPQLSGSPLPEVYPAAVAGSFYHPLFPAESLHLVTCFNAVLWMDHLPPAPIRDAVVYRRPTPPRPGLVVPPETEAAFTRQAADDLRRFFAHRAREVAPGGKVLVATPGSDDHGPCGDGLYDVLNDACCDLIAAGRINQAAYERLIIPVYFRTLEELLIPVQPAFHIDRAETLVVPTPFIEDFKATGNVGVFAAACTGFLRAFSEPLVRAALTGPDADADTDVVEAVYQRVHARLAAEPARYLFRYVVAAVLLTRC